MGKSLVVGHRREGRNALNNTTDGPARLLYNRKEAARLLSISVGSLDYLIANKELSTRTLGKRKLIPHGDLVKFARADHFGPIAAKAA